MRTYLPNTLFWFGFKHPPFLPPHLDLSSPAPEREGILIMGNMPCTHRLVARFLGMTSLPLLLGSITLNVSSEHLPFSPAPILPSLWLASLYSFFQALAATAAAAAGRAEKYPLPLRHPSSSHLPLFCCNSWHVAIFLASRKNKVCIPPVKADMESTPKCSSVSISKSDRVLLLLLLLFCEHFGCCVLIHSQPAD